MGTNALGLAPTHAVWALKQVLNSKIFAHLFQYFTFYLKWNQLEI